MANAKQLIEQEDFDKAELLGFVRPTKIWVAVINEEGGQVVYAGRTRTALSIEVAAVHCRQGHSWTDEDVPMARSIVAEYFRNNRHDSCMTTRPAYVRDAPGERVSIAVIEVDSDLRSGMDVLAGASREAIYAELSRYLVMPLGTTQDETEQRVDDYFEDSADKRYSVYDDVQLNAQ